MVDEVCQGGVDGPAPACCCVEQGQGHKALGQCGVVVVGVGCCVEVGKDSAQGEACREVGVVWCEVDTSGLLRDGNWPLLPLGGMCWWFPGFGDLVDGDGTSSRHVNLEGW
eukprot:2329761-Amphidinium_carterae.1